MTNCTGVSDSVDILSTAEPCLGIVAACLPTMRPLAVQAIAKCKRLTLRRRRINVSSSGDSYGPPAREFRNFQRLPGCESAPATSTQISSGMDVERSQVQAIPLHSIAVETSTSWDNQTNPAHTQSANTK